MSKFKLDHMFEKLKKAVQEMNYYDIVQLPGMVLLKNSARCSKSGLALVTKRLCCKI